MSTRPYNKSQMNTKSPNISPRLAANPENPQVPLWVVLDKLGIAYGPDPQLPLDGADKRRPLKQSARQRLDSTSQFALALDSTMKPNESDVLLSSPLLRLNQPRSPVYANNKASRNLGIERAGVPGLLDAEDALYPGDDLVGGGVGGLVEVYAAVGEVGFEGPGKGRAAGWDRGVVGGAGVELVVVLKEKRPVRGVKLGSHRLWLDHVLRRV
mmetsp:Transcript_9193/g.18619  ORF Transcript_9193/g.18619 Transcript_9193/m.18619 type:complete len:212 (+) Transcript_9193:1278-1913(+)